MNKKRLQVFVNLWKSALDMEIILVSKNFFLEVLISKIRVKINLTILKKNLQKKFLTKLTLNPFGHTSPIRHREC